MSILISYFYLKIFSLINPNTTYKNHKNNGAGRIYCIVLQISSFVWLDFNRRLAQELRSYRLNLN